MTSNTNKTKSNRPNVRKKQRARKKKKKALRIIALSFCFLLIFFLGFGAVYITSILNSTDKVEINQSKEELGIQETALINNEIINIALFGVDKRENGEKGRSDSIIILTIDGQHKKLKLTSLMRDTYVEIDGYKNDKLNHAYAFGGPQLAIKTINQNFNLDIKDFVTVDFGNLQDIIDALGGVIINVKDEEVRYVNANLKEQARLLKEKATPITNSGVQLLNGQQAVGYARIRSTAGGDFERTDRQRTVLEALFNEIKTAGVTEYPNIVKELLPLVQTSLGSGEILKIGTEVFKIGMSSIEQSRYPLDQHSNEGYIDSVWYIQYDKEETIETLQNYIYNDSLPNSEETPF